SAIRQKQDLVGQEMTMHLSHQRTRARGITFPRDHDLARVAERQIKSHQHLRHRTRARRAVRDLGRAVGTGTAPAQARDRLSGTAVTAAPMGWRPGARAGSTLLAPWLGSCRLPAWLP